MTERRHIPGGPGWDMDADTLLPFIHDLDAFRTEYQDDPAVEAIIALWSGDSVRAEALLAPLIEQTPTPRLRALRADTWRDQGRIGEAVAEYAELVAGAAGTPLRAVMLQHLGKVHFVARQFEQALACFEQALDLRTEANADPALIASSRASLERARTEVTT